jgi:hypothetical protein
LIVACGYVPSLDENIRFSLDENIRLSVVRALLAKGAEVNSTNKDGTTALLEACRYCGPKVVRALIANGADVNAKDNLGITALISLSYRGFEESVALKAVRALLASGADVDAKDNKGWTALMLASQFGWINLVKELLANGADVNAKDSEGATAMERASEGRHPEMVRALRARGPVAALRRTIARLRRRRPVGTGKRDYRGDLARLPLVKGAEANAETDVDRVETVTDPLDTSCRRCNKPIGPGGLRGGVAITGDDLFKLMEERSVYRCKSCGEPFCMDCMAKLKAKPCPVCKAALGW